MNRLTLTFITVASMIGSAFAMDLPTIDKQSDSELYVPSRAAVEATLDKMKVDYEIDVDGDIEIPVEFNDATGYLYVIAEEVNDGAIWNLRIMAQFATKPSRYDALVTYANEWNRDGKIPKLFMLDEETMVAEANYPVQFGYNPDEFEENYYYFLISNIENILSATYNERI